MTIGHAEGMPLAFANIYADLAEVIRAKQEGRAPDPAADLLPSAEDGLRSTMLRDPDGNMVNVLCYPPNG